MRENDIARLNALTDDLERRVKNLEIKKVNKDEQATIEFVDENMLFRPLNKEKIFKFSSRKNTYAVLNIEIKSSAAFRVQCEIYANGVLVKESSTSFPFTCELPMQTIDGENELKIVVYSNSSTASFDVNMKVSICGFVQKKEDDIKLAVVSQGQIFLRKNDTIKGINTDTLKTVICYTGKDASCLAASKTSYLTYVVKSGNTLKLERHNKENNVSYKTETLTDDFNRCAVEINGSITYLFCIKGENVYMYVKQLSGTVIKKLPFKAKDIFTYQGLTGRYIFYVDLRDNVTAIKHVSNLDYEEEKRVSLGKLENANICEEGGKLVALYKQGLVVLKKPVFESGEPTIVGIGDEGVISEDGVTIIRQKDKLIRL